MDLDFDFDFGTKPIKSELPESVVKRERSDAVVVNDQGQKRVNRSMLLSPGGGGGVEAQLRSGSGLVFEDERNMLSFASASCYPPHQSVYSRSSGDLGMAGDLSNSSMHVPLAGARQLFTPTQWYELEQQALIYKYISANVAVPSNLIIPMKKSFNPWGLSASISANGSLSSSSFGWGPFHLGFSGSSDPEPGRCRRTDGKKWRCAKDACPGHKYCEKHLNRGRHRSRKPVECQKPDQSVNGAINLSKVVPMASSLPKASVIPSVTYANTFAVPLHQSKGLHSMVNPFTDSLSKRMLDLHGISALSSAISLSSESPSFSMPKTKDPFEESYQAEFGFVSSDYLRNPYQKDSSSLNTSFPNFSDHQSQDQHPLRQFMEDWPKERSEQSSISLQEETKPYWTKLSMSIPMVSSGFSSSASSPAHERLALSPMRLGREFHRKEMGLGASNESSESFDQKQPSYMPVSPWGSTAGGPLGEVLKINTSNRAHIENPSALNLMPKGWESANSQFEPSPTGVLLKSTFGSLSNSSSGRSSPRAESRMTSEVGSLCNEALCPSLVSSVPYP